MWNFLPLGGPPTGRGQHVASFRGRHPGVPDDRRRELIPMTLGLSPLWLSFELPCWDLDYAFFTTFLSLLFPLTGDLLDPCLA